MIESVRALPVDRGLECRSARMTDMRGRRTRTQAPGIDPAAAKMWSRVGSEMPTAHMHRAAATAHTHSAAAAKMSATATTKVSTPAAPTTKVTATTTANMATTAPTPATETAASRVSGSCQAKGQPYCGRARRDFPHGTTSLSGRYAETNARSPGPFRRSRSGCCNAHAVECTSSIS
jgi:hypothetical protein